MNQTMSSFAHAFRVTTLGVAIVWGGTLVPALAQQTTTVATTPATPAQNAMRAATSPSIAQAPAAMGTTATVATPPTATPPVAAGAVPAATTAATPAAPGATTPAATTPASPAKAATDEVNPFSSVKPVDNAALKQELPAIEQRLNQMESQMSVIKQVQVAMPADALNGPGGVRAPGTPGQIDPATMELEAATFVACVNGQAMFRDSDQKPFFVNAKEANQNETVHRIGGCKH